MVERTISLKKSEDVWPAKFIKVNHTGYDEMMRSSRPTSFTRTRKQLGISMYGVTGNEDNFPLEPRNYSGLLRPKRVVA